MLSLRHTRHALKQLKDGGGHWVYVMNGCHTLWGVFAVLLISTLLGVTQYGIYLVVSNIGGIFLVLFSIHQANTYYIKRQDCLVHPLNIIALSVCFVGTMIAVTLWLLWLTHHGLGQWLLQSNQYNHYFFLFFAVAAFKATQSLLIAALIARQRFRTCGLYTACATAFGIIACLIYHSLHGITIESFALITAGSHVLLNIGLIVACVIEFGGEKQKRLPITLGFIHQFTVYASKNLAASCLKAVYTRSENIILPIFLGVTLTGIFGLLKQILMPLSFATDALASFLMPRFIQLVEKTNYKKIATMIITVAAMCIPLVMVYAVPVYGMILWFNILDYLPVYLIVLVFMTQFIMINCWWGLPLAVAKNPLYRFMVFLLSSIYILVIGLPSIHNFGLGGYVISQLLLAACTLLLWVGLLYRLFQRAAAYNTLNRG